MTASTTFAMRLVCRPLFGALFGSMAMLTVMDGGAQTMNDATSAQMPSLVQPEFSQNILNQVNASWIVDADPKRYFMVSQGQSPLTGYNGIAAQAQDSVVDRDENLEPLSPHATRLQDAMPPAFTSTTYKHDSYDQSYVTLRTEPDAQDTSHRVYKFTLSKAESCTPPATGKWVCRSEITCSGSRCADDYWGNEEIVVTALRYNSYWRTLTTPTHFPDPTKLGGYAEDDDEWYVLFQWHDWNGGLTRNPPISIRWKSGNGNPTQAGFNFSVRQYDHTVSPPSQRVVNSFRLNTASNVWHYFVIHYRSGWRDTATGATSHNFASKPPFVHIFTAAGGAPLAQVTDWNDAWGSPNPINPDKPGFWKTGIYMRSPMTDVDSAGNLLDVRKIYSKGYRQFRVSNFPAGMSDSDKVTYALESFKTHR